MSDGPGGLAFRLLGPLHAEVGGVSLRFARPQHRDLLGLFLLQPNMLLPVEQIIDLMWGPAAPPTATSQVQNMASALRSAVRSSPGAAALATPVRVVRQRTGYLLDVDESTVDAAVFDRTVAGAGAADPGQRARQLRSALALWRGPPLADIRAPYVTAARARLHERRFQAVEALYDAELAVGRHAQVVPELTAEVAEAPLRESLVAQLMVALYRCGRQADALHAYRTARRRLLQEQGLDPGPALRETERLVLAGDARLDGPPAAVVVSEPAPATGHHRTPSPPAHFVGRTDALAEVTSAVHAGGVAAIHGPPGVGKTALALIAAEAVRTDFPGGQLFVDLGGPTSGLTAHQLLGLILRAVGVAGAALPVGTPERTVLLRAVLDPRRLLLVLDNAAGEHQVRPVLEGRWPGAIVTSRVRLAALADAVHVRLPLLAERDARQLLGRLAPEHVAADPAAAASIIELCGGLPLAVRIAGAKLAARPHWSAARLAGRLRDERRTLDELSLGDHAVRASLELSFTSLSVPALRALRVVGALGRTEVEPWLVAAALGTAEPAAMDALEELVTAELLTACDRSADRYRVHDLTRMFGRERFDAVEPPGERAAVARRVAQAYLAVALRAEHELGLNSMHPCGRWSRPWVPAPVVADAGRVPAVPDLVAWLSDRSADVAAAVARVHAEGLWAHAWTLGRALCPVLEVGGQTDRWREVMRLAAEAADRAGEPLWAAAIDMGFGTLYQSVGEWDRSQAALERAIAVCDEAGDRQLAAHARLTLTGSLRVTMSAGRQTRIAELLDRASADTSGDPILRELILCSQALLDLDHEQPRRGVERLLRALELADTPRRRAKVLLDLGTLRTACGDLHAAVRDLNASLGTFDALGDSHSAGATLCRLGDALCKLGLPQRAVPVLERAVATFDPGFLPWAASAMSRLADAHRDSGDHAAAEELLVRAVARFARLGLSTERAYVEVSLGELRAAQGDDEAALAAFVAARARLGETHPIRGARATAGADAARARLAARRRHAPATRTL